MATDQEQQIADLEQEAKNADTLAQMCRLRAMGRRDWAPAYTKRAQNYRERVEQLRRDGPAWVPAAVRECWSPEVEAAGRAEVAE